MFDRYEKKLHEEYDRADAVTKERIDRAFMVAAEVLREEDRKLCNGDGAERLVAHLYRYYMGLD